MIHRESKIQKLINLINYKNYKIIDKLAMANSDRWYGLVMRREDGHVLRWALYFEVEGQRKVED